MDLLAGNRELLDRFRAGERAVLADVYRHYLGPLAEVLRQGFAVHGEQGVHHVPGLQSPHEIECACHEVFLRAFRPGARQAYDGVRAYGNYLYRIARNWRIDEFRRRRPQMGLDELEEELADPTGTTADEQMVDRELGHLIDRYLSELPEKDRTYFEARYREGLAQTDAAARQGLTRIQGRRIEARVKAGLLAWLHAHGHHPVTGDETP